LGFAHHWNTASGNTAETGIQNTFNFTGFIMLAILVPKPGEMSGKYLPSLINLRQKLKNNISTPHRNRPLV